MTDKHDEGLSIPINSSYYDIHKFNQIKTNVSSSLGLIHTNLASINKIFDDLSLVLSLLKFNFHVIAITELKIHKNDENAIANISLEDYYPFEYDPT